MPHFESFDKTRLYYRDEGTGAPVIALAGLTRNGADFDHIAPHLPCRLIRLDYRGRGRSDWANWHSYTIPTEARDTLALMDHLGLEQAAILGTSRGGLIAMALAATAKTRLTGVALNDIGPELSPEGLSAIADYLGKPPAAKTLTQAAQMLALTPGFANAPPERWAHEAANRYVETKNGLALRHDPKLREAVLTAVNFSTPDLWPLFDALDGRPLALIRGANSNLLSAATATEMARRRPDMIRADVADRGHVPFLDEPEALHALTQWLEALP